LKHEPITLPHMPDANQKGFLSPEVAENCAELTLKCSDSAGQIIDVAQQLKSDLNLLRHLEDVTLTLETDQNQAMLAAKETKNLAGQAKDRIVHSFGRVENSINDYQALAQMLRRLGMHVTDFAVVLEQVRSVSQTISTIARTTNMLALNASIEAERAGDAGRTFAVVAAEIKRLAHDTRAATDDITRSVGSLVREASDLIGEIEMGAEQGTRVESNFNSISLDLEEAINLVIAVDRSSETIMGNTSLVLSTGSMVRSVLNDFSENVRAASDNLETTSAGVTEMEATANGMFNAMVQSGQLPTDSAFVERAILASAHFASLAQSAMESGELSKKQVFDDVYVPIEGSNPPRFTNSLCAWASRVWQPEYDKMVANDPRITAVVCSDRNGFLPTHTSLMAQEPTGNLQHDTKYCRNGRIIMAPVDVVAKVSDDRYFMSVYRHEGDGKTYYVIRNVYVPLYIFGERWGDFEIAYRI
jgi:methyl-accepting chemotaxis protein